MTANHFFAWVRHGPRNTEVVTRMELSNPTRHKRLGSNSYESFSNVLDMSMEAAAEQLNGG